MPEIRLELIDDNPFRHRDLNPIDQEQVEKLMASIGKDGFWASVVARQIGERYELAFGHTRIEAARQLGLATAPIDVRQLSDLQMARMLANENGIQRDAGIAPCLDAVAGISEFMAYALMVSEDDATLSRNCEGVALNYATARGMLTAGQGIGQPSISGITNSYNSHQVREALAILKDSGRMTAIVAGARAKADAALQAREATPALEKALAGNAKAVAAITEKRPAIFDDRCVHLFRLEAHAEAFRKIVSSETVRSYLPVDQQYGFAKQVMEELQALHHLKEITADMIRGTCWDTMHRALGIPHFKLRNSPDRPSLDRIKEALNRIRRAEGDFRKGMELLRNAETAGDQPDDQQEARLDKMFVTFAEGMQEVATRRRPRLTIVGGKS